MNSKAIMNVTEEFRARLKAALVAAGYTEDVFVGPLDDPDVGGSALVLFLYRIVPNPNLRNTERRVPSDKPPEVRVFQNSLPVDLHYLVTVGSTSGGSEELGLHKICTALQAVQSEPNLSGPLLDYEVVRVTLEPLTTEEASRIWSLFPTANYRTSVAFVASPVWIDPESRTDPARAVTDDRLIAGRKPEEVSV